MLLNYRERVQEGEVRGTAQRLLTEHLRPGDDFVNPDEAFWTDIDLDLNSATLLGWDLANCRVRNANFNVTQFTSLTDFRKAQFTGFVRFNYAQFTGMARFDDARFTTVGFRETRFTGRAEFSGAQFEQRVPPEIAALSNPTVQDDTGDRTESTGR